MGEVPQELLQKYRGMGYSDKEIADAFKEVQKEQPNDLQKSYEQAKQQQVSRGGSATMYANSYNENLVEQQLNVNEILEKVEHFLRGDRPEFINGSYIFMPPKNNYERTFTEEGVSEIMKNLTLYLNKNTILSNYDEETINWKVYDFGKEISDLIYLKYDTMFAYPDMNECFQHIFKTKDELVRIREKEWAYKKDDKWYKLSDDDLALVDKEFRTQKLEKRKLYPMVVRSLVDVVHSSYLRALNGSERDSLRRSMSFNQTEQMSGGQVVGINGVPRQERSILNPLRYLAGRFK